ncbi:MAG: hypothetical protein VSS75_014750 [Candidatus Parabeggiatoa sp.]|nr:hypothetical protein [Candidatus Parabeggiatoa sp.]
MKNSLILSVLILPLFVEVVNAVEEDSLLKQLTITPRIVNGVMSYKYEEEFTGSDNVKWHDIMPFLGLGVTLGYNNWSIDAYAQKSFTGKDGLFAQSETITRDYATDFTREDYAVNMSYKTKALFGYKMRGVLSFFAGYKYGKTEITGPRSITISSLEESSFSFSEMSLKTNGYSIGGGYSWPIGKSGGLLGIKGAFATLDGDYDSNELGVVTTPTIFTWISINWSSALSKKVTYAFSLDAHNYAMEATPTDQPGVTLSSIEERIISLKALLSYTF